LIIGQLQWIVREEAQNQISGVGSSEKDTEAFEHWLDTVDRQRESIDHWTVTVDRQRGGTNQI